MDDYLEILEWTLLAGHISPTAPDTLGKGLQGPGATQWGAGSGSTAHSAPPGCYPFYNSDPFILTDCPHVYFCGNAPKFQSKLLTGESPLLPVPSPVPTRAPCLPVPQGRMGSGCCWWQCQPSVPRRPPASSTCATSAASPSASPSSVPRMTVTWRWGSDSTAQRSPRPPLPQYGGRSDTVLLPIQLCLFVQNKHARALPCFLRAQPQCRRQLPGHGDVCLCVCAWPRGSRSTGWCPRGAPGGGSKGTGIP